MKILKRSIEGKTSIQLKNLHHDAIKEVDYARTREELRKIDMTRRFFTELQQRRERKNVINISVTGEQSSGKSLVGFALTKFIQEHLHNKRFSIKQIDHDQIDFINSVSDETRGMECRQIDEWNELATTGFNSSTNQALFTQINEVQAQRFIDKVAISPVKIVDQTASILLEVLEKDIPKKSTVCLVSYMVNRGNVTIPQLLGHVVINVADCLEDPTYYAYRAKKMLKMKLLWKYKLKDWRDVNEAKLKHFLVKKYEKAVSLGASISKDRIRNSLTSSMEKLVALSILGEDDIIAKVHATLSYPKDIRKWEHRLKALQQQLPRSNEEIKNVLKKEIEIHKELIADSREEYNTLINNMEKIIEIAEAFENVSEEEFLKASKELDWDEIDVESFINVRRKNNGRNRNRIDIRRN